MADTAVHPAVDRLHLVLEWLREPEDLTVADMQAVFDTSGWNGRWTLEEELAELQQERHIVRPITVEGDMAVRDEQASVIVVGADEKRWAVSCWIGAPPEHRITGFRWIPAPPDGTVVRDARPDDAAALTELEHRSPLRLGDMRMTFDRGEDYFGCARLMDEVTIYVAEVDGAIAGVYWGAVQPVLVSGERKHLFLEHHVRIDPATRRGGVFWALCIYGRDRYARTTDSIAFYVSPENHAVRKFVEHVPSWSVQALRALVPCARAQDGPPGRRATPDDASEIVAVLNAAHDGEELFVPYTVETLTARLERAPDQYGWSSIRIGDGAVLGVSEHPVRVRKERDGASEETCRALVLDHGCLPGREAAFAELLSATATEQASLGRTHLALFTSAPSRTHDVVASAAVGIEPFDFWAFDIAEPPGLAACGLYVDPVYF